MDRLKREANPPVGQLASPVPQYKRPGSTDYDPVEGQHGAPFATLKDASGNVVSPATEDKLEQVRQLLTGVATEAKLEQARVLLNTISNKDFATQATLEVVQSELALIKSELANIKANQLSGDQKVTLSGNFLEVVMPRGILNSNSGVYRFDVPAGAKGLSLTLAVHGVTGTLAENQGIKISYALVPRGQNLWVNNILGGEVGILSTSTTRSGYASHQLTIYPGLTEVTSERVHKWDMAAAGLRIMTRVDVSGNFGSGEGFDCELRVVYIP